MTVRPERRTRDLAALGHDVGATQWLETYWPTLHYAVRTFWYDNKAARTVIMSDQAAAAGVGPEWMRDYDPTRVTIGGLAEAHEAVCARVERGELP